MRFSLMPTAYPKFSRKSLFSAALLPARSVPRIFASSASSSTARCPILAASTLSNADGLPPRWMCPRIVTRGGTPTARDRVMATRMGYHAVKVLAEGGTNRLICSQQGSMVDIDLEEGLAMKKGLNAQQYEVLQAMTGLEIEGL